MTRSGVIVAAMTGLILAGCAPGAEPAEETLPEAAVGTAVAVEGGSYTDLNVQELQAMLAAKDFPLVNVHVPFEGDLPDTDLSIPFDEILNHLDKLPPNRDARIVLYCNSGRMSADAAEELVKLGYTNVYNLAGGFRAWGQAGLPIIGR